MASRLDPDSLNVQSFDTAPIDAEPVPITAPPVTVEKWADSCCYVCYETRRTMCGPCSYAVA